MLTDAQFRLAHQYLANPPDHTVDGHSLTTLAPSSRRDVENWASSGVAGNIGETHARDLADEIIDDAHELGLSYGDDWAPMLAALTEAEFSDYVHTSEKSLHDALATR